MSALAMTHSLTPSRNRRAEVRALSRDFKRFGRAAQRGLHKDSIGEILKQVAGHAGVKTKPIAGHSLRAGCVAHAEINCVNERDVMCQTGNESPAMLAKYIRIGQMFKHNLAAGLGI